MTTLSQMMGCLCIGIEEVIPTIATTKGFVRRCERERH